MFDESRPISLDALSKYVGSITVVVCTVFAVYLHLTSITNELENRIVELEKQNLREEKYQEYTTKNRVDIENIQNDMKSMNETMMEILRTLRSRSNGDYVENR